jgi:hypothetical protein
VAPVGFDRYGNNFYISGLVKFENVQLITSDHRDRRYRIYKPMDAEPFLRSEALRDQRLG